MGHYDDCYDAVEREQQAAIDEWNRKEIREFIDDASSYELEMLGNIIKRFDAWKGVFEVFKMRK
jgi:hypothetical protein